MDYKARLYDPALGRFIQPDSIIPGMGDPQSLNRYSYVQNRPVVFNDPTGHVQESDAYSQSYGRCDKGDTSCNWVRNSPGKNPGHIKDSHDRRDKPPKTESGTIYASISVNTLSDYDNRNFGAKAQDSYNDFGPQYEPVLNIGGGGWYLITNGISLLEDALDTGKKLPVYSISVAINWQQTGKMGPMVFNSVTISNGAPAYIRDPVVAINKRVFQGPARLAGQGESLTIDLNGYSVPYAARKNILIEVSGYGQTVPDYPHMLVMNPGGFSPPPGCSSPVLCAIP